MLEFLQMTAAYSNAVLTLVMSNATDVATKLDLDVPKPIQPAHVRKFICDPRQGSIGGRLILTNGFQFWYEYGTVYAAESSHCYFYLQDPDDIPRFYGTFHMSEAEALELGRASLRKMGYNLPWLMTNLPTITKPGTAKQDRPKVVPHFRLKWHRLDEDGMDNNVDMEINAEAKRVEMYFLIGPDFHRPPPNIPQPPVLPGQPKPAPRRLDFGMTPLAEPDRAKVLADLCQKATIMAQKLKLPVALPIKVKTALIGEDHREIRGVIILEEGWRFSYWNGHIGALYAPDSEENYDLHETYTNIPPWDAAKVRGKVNYDKQQVAAFATKLVRQLGLPDHAICLDQPPKVYGGPQERDPRGTRYYVHWEAPGMDDLEAPDAWFTRMEVDGVKLELKSLYFVNCTNLYQPDVVHLPPPAKPATSP